MKRSIRGTTRSQMPTCFNDTEERNMQAQINGNEIFYTIHGQGRPMLLMHGGSGLDHTYFRRHLEIRIRWEHARKKASSQQAGDFRGEPSPADGVILPARRRHSSQRHKSPLEPCPVRADGAAAAAEWPPKPVALPPASDRLGRY